MSVQKMYSITFRKPDGNTTTDTKVKGAAETEYHTGNVNVIPANIGITIT